MMRILLVLLCAASCAHAAGARRVALVVGANDGGADRVRLRYAVTDAEALGAVLGELGGIAPRDMQALAEPTRAALRGALQATAQRLSTLRGRVEFVFYYSGHSDEAGLLMGGERLPYSELRQLIGAVPATVRIAIVDACASGALTRTKGGVRKAPFLLDESNAVAGSAILTSASAEESAQESDRIGGSFFTHALLTGLRGAADRSGDGRVTLTEAYQFAYAETLARTETTRIGAQHPNYDLQLSGRGEVVLTDIRATAAGLTFSPDLGGRLSIREPGGHLVAELTKPAGRDMELGLPAGRYLVHWHDKGRTGKAEVEVPAGRRARLGAANFVATDAPVHRARGGAAVDADHVAFTFIGTGGALDGFELGIGNRRDGPVSGAQIGAIFSFNAAEVDGLQLSGVFNHAGGAVDGAQIAGVLNIAGGTDGVQLGGVVNWTGAVDGAQIAGVSSIANGGIDGLQLSGVASVARGNVDGLQLSGVTNFSEEVEGAQIAGVVNLARSVSGLQLGLINIGGDVDGTQIGLINIARRMRGAPIGLINAIGDGVHRVEAWSSDEHVTNLGFRLGSQTFQTILAVGSDDFDTLRPGAGLGGRFATGALDVTLDALWFGPTIRPGQEGDVSADLDDMSGRVRLLVGWGIGPVRVFGGPVARLTFDEQVTPLAAGGSTSKTTVDAAPGFAVGLSVF